MSCLFKRFPTLSLLQWHQETGWLNQQPRSCEDKSIQNSTTSPLFSISGNISWIEKTEPGNEANSFYFICLKWVVLLWLVCSAGILQSHEPEVVEYMLLEVRRALHLSLCLIIMLLWEWQSDVIRGICGGTSLYQIFDLPKLFGSQITVVPIRDNSNFEFYFSNEDSRQQKFGILWK